MKKCEICGNQPEVLVVICKTKMHQIVCRNCAGKNKIIREISNIPNCPFCNSHNIWGYYDEAGRKWVCQNCKNTF